MQRAKSFFFVSAGICLLALAYHLGATSATAQVGGASPVTGFFDGSSGGGVVVMTNGDVYVSPTVATNYANWARVGNVFAGGPTPAQAESFGHVKAKYR